MQRHTNIPAVYLIPRRGHEFLMLRRFNTGYMDGYYSFVAGHVEANESMRTALLREAKEEAGISIDSSDVEFVHVLHRKSGEEERVDMFFTVDIWDGQLKNMEPQKCDDFCWVTIENLPKKTIPYVRHVLECINRGEKFSEEGWE